MPSEGIVDGVEYEIIQGRTGTANATAGDRGPGASGAATGSSKDIIEYAQALQTFAAGSTDRLAALEVAILGWLDAKRGRSGSERTHSTYAGTLDSFRAALRREGIDLDAPATPVALVAQAWAGNNGPGTSPAPTTYNQRLACVSSFYKYACKQGILEHNPIERVERRWVQAYAGSKALTANYVKERLASIDRTTPAGARDYALLMVYLQTGRRLSEVAALDLGDMEETLSGGSGGRGAEAGRGKVRLTFRRCKGGKVMHDTLTPQISAALRTYLHIIYGPDLRSLRAELPVWVSLAERNGTRGGRLSKVSISRICKARLGTSRVHALRHTMAQVMEQRHAPVSLIQQRLGHSSLATTGIYLAALRQDENPYADELGEAFGAD